MPERLSLAVESGGLKNSTANSGRQNPPALKGRFPVRGYVLIVLTAFFTALSYAIGKYLDTADDSGLDPETTAFFWFCGAFAAAFFVSLLIPSQRRELGDFRKYGTIFILTSVFTSLGAALWVGSLWIIGPSLTSFLMKSQTLFSLLLGIIFLRERVNGGETAGIVLTVAGGIMVAYHKDQYLLLGVGAVLVSALCYSMVSFCVRKFGEQKRLNMLTVATLRTFGVSLILFVYLIATGTFEMPQTREIVFMAAGGICGAYIAKASQFHAIKILDLSRSTAVMPLESLFVVLLSLALFDKVPSTAKLLGGICILAGVVFLVIFRDEKQGKREAAVMEK